MNDLKVFRVSLENIDEVVPLFDAYRMFYKKVSDLEGALSFLSERIKNNESIVFICKADHQVAGFVQLYPLFSSTRMKRLWLLNDLFVAGEFRGQGVSKALIEACKSLSAESRACGLMLETAKDNLIANNLYLKTQFELDEDHNYYFFGT